MSAILNYFQGILWEIAGVIFILITGDHYFLALVAIGALIVAVASVEGKLEDR